MTHDIAKIDNYKTIYAILKEGIMGNIHVKLYEIWNSGSKIDVVKRKSLRMDTRQTDGRINGQMTTELFPIIPSTKIAQMVMLR